VLAILACASAPGAQVTLGWTSPTLDINGQPLTGLAGFRIHYGTNSHVYSSTVSVGNVTSHTLSNLNGTATYYMAITAFNAQGEESAMAGEMAWSATDADADGMADAWEIAHLAGVAASLAIATADADGDGLCNLDEFIGGSIPTNAADTASFLDVICANGQVCVLFDARQAAGAGYSGKSRFYAIERCTNAAAGAWAPVSGYTSIYATNQTVTYAAGVAPGAAMVRTKVWLQ
jgi:hypothetical protein